MNLFLVIYMGGMIGGTVGPLPYGFDECQVRVQSMIEERDQGLALGINIMENRPLTDEERSNIESLDFKCEFHDIRPINTYQG